MSSTAKIIQFPLTLSFAATSHKFQGQTIRKPNKSANDLNSVFQAAQTYTILSRVESISQLFIIGSLPKSKFYADQKALEELGRLDRISVNKNPLVWEQSFDWSVKINCFNIRSLLQHFDDLKADPMFRFSDVMCINETWLTNDSYDQNIQLAGYTLHLNSAGHGRGLATYYKMNKFTHCRDVKEKFMQLTKLSSPDIDVISVYRSKEGSKHELVLQLKSLIEEDKATVLCGDFNYCLVEDGNLVTEFLEKIGFTEYANCATHIKGGHIDHMYFR